MSVFDYPDTWDLQQVREWFKWFNERPPAIKEMVLKYPPWKKYKMKATGDDWYEIMAWNEGGHFRVVRHSSVTGEPMWEVFGVEPKDLIECVLST